MGPFRVEMTETASEPGYLPDLLAPSRKDTETAGGKQTLMNKKGPGPDFIMDWGPHLLSFPATPKERMVRKQVTACPPHVAFHRKVFPLQLLELGNFQVAAPKPSIFGYIHSKNYLMDWVSYTSFHSPFIYSYHTLSLHLDLSWLFASAFPEFTQC